MTQKNSPANPTFHATSVIKEKGLTAIEHAALVTGQPCSGTEWLDDMIRAQRRERLAGQIAAGAIANSASRSPDYTLVATSSVTMADALISALEGGAK